MEYIPTIHGREDPGNFPVEDDDEALTLDSAIEEFIVGDKGDLFEEF